MMNGKADKMCNVMEFKHTLDSPQWQRLGPLFPYFPIFSLGVSTPPWLGEMNSLRAFFANIVLY